MPGSQFRNNPQKLSQAEQLICSRQTSHKQQKKELPRPSPLKKDR
jgi:hypothetical protein